MTLSLEKKKRRRKEREEYQGKGIFLISCQKLSHNFGEVSKAQFYFFLFAIFLLILSFTTIIPTLLLFAQQNMDHSKNVHGTNSILF